MLFFLVKNVISSLSALLVATMLKSKDIVVTRRPNLPSNKKVRLSTIKLTTNQKNTKKKTEKNYALQLIIKDTLIYCDVFFNVAA